LEFNVPFQHKYGYIRDEYTFVRYAIVSSCDFVLSPKIVTKFFGHILSYKTVYRITTVDCLVTYLCHDICTRSGVARTDHVCRRVLIAFGWWLGQWTGVCDKPCRPPTGQMQCQFTTRLQWVKP